jgi:hypothetical protein
VLLSVSPLTDQLLLATQLSSMSCFVSVVAWDVDNELPRLNPRFFTTSKKYNNTVLVCMFLRYSNVLTKCMVLQQWTLLLFHRLPMAWSFKSCQTCAW